MQPTSAQPTPAIHTELNALLRTRPLSFPIETQADFIEQMARGGDRVAFGGVLHDTRLGAGLLPDFMFPLSSLDDLVAKASELIISRGLAPLPPAHLVEAWRSE